RNVGNLSHRAFGEKRVNQRPRLIGRDALFEDLALLLAALGERQGGGSFDCVHGSQGSYYIWPRLAQLIPRSGENRWAGKLRTQFAAQLAGLRKRAALTRDLARER